MGSGRIPTCIGLVAVLAVLAAAPAAVAQPVRRVAALDEPFGGVAERADRALPTMSPVPPRTAYQPPRRDPDGVPYEPDFTLPDGSAIPLPQSRRAWLFAFATSPCRGGRRRVSQNSQTVKRDYFIHPPDSFGFSCEYLRPESAAATRRPSGSRC